MTKRGGDERSTRLPTKVHKKSGPAILLYDLPRLYEKIWRIQSGMGGYSFMRVREKDQKETQFMTDFEKELNGLALACQGVKDKPEFLKPFFEKLFVRFDSRLGAAILQEIIYRAIIGKELGPAPLPDPAPVPVPAPAKRVPQKTIREIERAACRKSIQDGTVTKDPEIYWGNK